MKTTDMKRLLSFILCIVLVAAMALFAGCSDSKKTETPSENITEQSEQTADVKELGEGNTKFDFSVVDKDGNETKFVVKTDKKTVGEALLDAGLIEGEDGPYGLYVKKVNGITADFETDGTYWGFFVNDAMAPAGVDMTEIKDGESYAFKVSK